MVVDEFSRFHFAFSCKGASNERVKKCLLHLFSLFGMAKYMHCDRCSSLISDESPVRQDKFFGLWERQQKKRVSQSAKKMILFDS